MRIAYFHCIGGASGDMVLGALLDAGLPVEALHAELLKLKVSGFSLEPTASQRGAVAGTHVGVRLDEEKDPPRRWQDFLDLIDASALPETVKEKSCAVFQRLSEAEARAHRVPVKEAQLHELGSLDTLLDVVGAVSGLELLGVERIYASPLPVGSGMVKSGHGVLPVPAPATAELLAMANAPVILPASDATNLGEMLTPTGAAIITTLASFERPSMTVQRIGYGLGTRDSPHYPNALALWLGEGAGLQKQTGLLLLETNIDDMSPELFGYVQERLLDQGARDAWFTPIQMKKSRPAVMLSVLVPESAEGQAMETIMRETSTLGIRVRPVERYEAQREVVTVETSFGPAQVKVKRLDGKAVSLSPEYEVCRSIALERGISLQEVYRRVVQEASSQIMG